MRTAKNVMTKKGSFSEFFVSGYQIQKIFWSQRTTNKMSLSVQCSVVESFKFNDKNIRAFYIKDVGQYLHSQDVYTTVGTTKKMGSRPCNDLFQKSKKCDWEML